MGSQRFSWWENHFDKSPATITFTKGYQARDKTKTLVGLPQEHKLLSSTVPYYLISQDQILFLPAIYGYMQNDWKSSRTAETTIEVVIALIGDLATDGLIRWLRTAKYVDEAVDVVKIGQVEVGVVKGAGNLLNAEGKFIDNLLETDYAKYLTRKATQGKTPRGRLDWKEARDYWLFDSPMARGNSFNKKAFDLGWYDYFEINLANGKRLDSYVPPSNGKVGEIISRKATNLEEIELSTFENYLKEMQTKYPASTTIRSNKYPVLDGQILQGKQILEIPISNQGFSQIQDYIDLPKNKYNIEIRFRPE